MRCCICDVELTEKEISFDRELKSNPCTTCQQIIYETAFSGKFKQGLDDEEDFGDDFEPDEQKFTEMIEEDFYYEAD